jgi:hypothetical protein
MFAILAFIAFVFLLLVFIMIQVRRVGLSKAVKKLTDTEKNDHLRVTEQDLKKMYPRIKEIWDRRADRFPIPEVGRIPAGWMRTENGRAINIRDEIVDSFNAITQRASAVGLQFARLPHQTVTQLFNVLLKRKVGTLKRETCTRYMGYYNLARYGAPSVKFDQAQYSQFLQVFQTLLDQILPRNPDRR